MVILWFCGLLLTTTSVHSDLLSEHFLGCVVLSYTADVVNVIKLNLNRFVGENIEYQPPILFKQVPLIPDWSAGESDEPASCEAAVFIMSDV